MPPFSDHEVMLIDIASYRTPQELGGTICNAEVQALEYHSACCSECGYNVTSLTPVVFTEKCPHNLAPWLCETIADYMAFKPAHASGSPKIFS